MSLVGISPKLYPCLLGIAIGGVLIAFGDSAAGLGVLSTGALALIAGYQLPVGQVLADPTPSSADPSDDLVIAGEGSDQRLAPDVLANIAAQSGDSVQAVTAAVGGAVTAVGGLVGGLLTPTPKKPR